MKYIWSYLQELPDDLWSQVDIGIKDSDLEHVYVYGLIEHADLMAPLTLGAATEMAQALLTAVRQQLQRSQEAQATSDQSAVRNEYETYKQVITDGLEVNS